MEDERKHKRKVAIVLMIAVLVMAISIAVVMRSIGNSGVYEFEYEKGCKIKFTQINDSHVNYTKTRTCTWVQMKKAVRDYKELINESTDRQQGTD
jgi:flagellar basal body-associated protein FliL